MAIVAATATLHAADTGLARGAQSGTDDGTFAESRGAAPFGPTPGTALLDDLALWQGVPWTPPPGVPAPSRRIFHPVRWDGRAAEFSLRGLSSSSVRRGHAAVGRYRARLRPAVVKRGARRGTLRLRFPAHALRSERPVPHTGSHSSGRADARLVVTVRPAWTLVFREEFRGSSLDPRVWHTCFWWATTTCSIQSNDELALYRPENVEVADGVLRLRAERSDAVAWNGRTYRYASGMAMTGGRLDEKPPGLTFTYGYAEARVRVPSGTGLWPAFWMLPASYRSRPEIDVMEILGHSPSTQNMTLHYLDRWGGRGDPGATWTGPDFSADWHTFGVDWQPGVIVWYVDGVERWRFSRASAIPREPMYLLLNLAVGGPWAGAPDESTSLPSHLHVDYVRLWQ
jgi:beta-glucanase (GH16 family)